MEEELKDKVLQCKDCGKDFTITVDDQHFYKQKGFVEPKRCKKCRRDRRLEKGTILNG